MSVLIKGMKMPESCPCELLGIGYDLHCSFAEGIPARVKEYYECCQNNKRPSWCPLVELPPHGRLIDADSLKETLDYYIREAGWSDEINEALTWVRDEFIDHEPTIIEAEGVSE